MSRAPRVTVGIPAKDRAGLLPKCLRSVLAQGFEDFEIVICDDGSSDGTGEAALALGDPRIRVVRHDVNQGISAARNTIFRELRGELHAWMDSDDLAQPDWLERSVAVFDRRPATAVVHGDVLVIDEHDREVGVWEQTPRSGMALVRQIIRGTNPVRAPGSLMRAAWIERCGPLNPAYPVAHDMDLWLRALRLGARFAALPGGPGIRYRRHDDNISAAGNRGTEMGDVAEILRRELAHYDLRDIVPELDWEVGEPDALRERAVERLADDLAERGVPDLASELRAGRVALRLDDAPGLPARPTRAPRRIGMTAFGWNDPGGGTLLPRLTAKELARRGHRVSVFHAAVARLEGAERYAVRDWEEDGVRLIGVHNKDHVLMDLGHPERELDDPQITAAFERHLDEERPDLLHVHNLHNLGLALLDAAGARGLRTLYTPHNLWLVCARNHLMKADGSLCDGPLADGSNCSACCGGTASGYAHRRTAMRAAAAARIGRVLAVSETVRGLLRDDGFAQTQSEVLLQATPAVGRTWDLLGRDRPPGRVEPGRLVIGFLGAAAWPIKGADLLVRAAQLVDAPLSIELHGSIDAETVRRLRALDGRGLLEICGPYSGRDLPGVLAGLDASVVPSLVWEAAPLVATETLAGRVPVVAARMGGLQESVRDGVDGLLFDGGSVASLAAALRRLALEPGLVEALQAGIAAPRRFEDYVDDLERLYAGVEPEPAGASEPVPVAWEGDQERASSLAMINRSVAGRLGPSTDGVVVGIRARDVERADAPLPRPPAVTVRHQWPPDFAAPASGRLALIQPWEFGSIPRDWLEPLRGIVDELWVPSEYVRSMYVADGVDADRVHVVPNGVDLERLRPEGPRLDLGLPAGTLTLLYVGGSISRKGVDVLVDAYLAAFAGRDDVALVIKDVGGATFYKGIGLGERLRELAARAEGPRLVYLDDELDDEAMGALYRSAHALVHPYRGEGFAMPVLEAMACGLPVAVTAGGPTDEFCDDAFAWRFDAARRDLEPAVLGGLQTVSAPWWLEPDHASVVEVLRRIADDRDELAARGAAARRRAEEYGWDAVARRYGERIRALAARPARDRDPAPSAFALPDPAPRNLLALPAWRGEDALDQLLAAWATAFAADAPVQLYLLADPALDGGPEDWERHVLAAAARASVELESLADISVLDQAGATAELDRIVAAADGCVPLHPGCAGAARIAQARGIAVLEPDADALRAWADG